MATTLLATALPYSLADDAPFQLTVFFTHKLTGDSASLADYPAAADWVTTLAGCNLGLTTSLDPATSLPLRIVSTPDADAWRAVLPSDTTAVAPFPSPRLSDRTWRTNPASRMSDHAIDLHLAAITASPAFRPRLAGDPVAGGLLETLANLDQQGPLRRLLNEAPIRDRRLLQLPNRRLREALTTIGPLDDHDDVDPHHGHGGELEPPPPYASEIVDVDSPVQVLLDDPDADNRVTERLDRLVGKDNSADPTLQLIVDAHAMRRYYERPELPQEPPRAEPDPNAAPTPRPDPPKHDFHAKVAQFGSTPALLRRLGLAVDVVLDGLDAEAARAALQGATWVSVTVSSPDPDLEVLAARRTAVVVRESIFAARSSAAWLGGALPLGNQEWVVLDTDPDAGGLKLDQHARNLARQYATEANGDPATSAPGTLRATGFALARRGRADELRARVQQAEALAVDDGARELLLDDLVRGIRVEVWDDATKQWHSLHRRLVTVTDAIGAVQVLADEPDVGFLQLSALNRPPEADTGYYVHEVLAGWDGWSLSAPRPGLTIVHVEPPGPDGQTETVVDTPPDEPIDGAHVRSLVEPRSLPRLRYGTSYSFRVLAVDLAGNSVPQPLGGPPAPTERDSEPDVAAAQQHLDRLREEAAARDRASVLRVAREAVIEQRQREQAEETQPSDALPGELRTGVPNLDAILSELVDRAAAESAESAGGGERSSSQRTLVDVVEASRILAQARDSLRVHPQLRIDAKQFAEIARGDDLPRPEDSSDEQQRWAGLFVTTPRPYLRWEPVPAPAIVPRHQLGTGEQPAALVVRSGIADGANVDTRPTAERHLAPPKATQLEAEAAGKFDTAIGTGDAAEIRRLYAIALAERGTLLDQYVPSLTDARTTDEQPGIELVDRPGADTGSPHRATLADITADRGRPIGEGQYVIHDTPALRLPYLPDPFAEGVSLGFYEAGSPHLMIEPRALQSVSVPYPGQWPSPQPLLLIVERGEELRAHVNGHEVHVEIPPGVQVRAALSSSLRMIDLEKFGLWRSHLASVATPEDGYTTDEVIAAAALMRAAASGWTWWLTPSTDVRLVHAVPAPVRAPELRDLSLLLRPPGRAVAALSGLVNVHGSSTDTLLVTARWTEWVDDPAATGPQQVAKADVVVRSPVGERERTGVLFLYDFQPTGPLAELLGWTGFHKMVQTFPDTHHREVTYVPSGTTRFAEFFEPSQLPTDPPEGEPIVLDIPSSARPAAPEVLDAVPLLRWEAQPEPNEPFGWRRVRRSGVRIWLARPWFSSGDGELLGVLVFDANAWTQAPDGTWSVKPKPLQAPDGATSLWAADPIVLHGGATSNPTVPPLLGLDQLLLDSFETAFSGALGQQPPLGGRPIGSRDRGWDHSPGSPVAVAESLPLRDVQGRPEARVLGYQPEFDEASGRWFVDVAVQETPPLWPFLRLAVARYQPASITGCELSPVAVTSWVQPLPTRTLTVTRPDATHVQVTLSGVVSWLRFDRQAPELPGMQLSADSPTGEAAQRASRLQQSRIVRASLQRRDAGTGDLQWQTAAAVQLLAVSVDEANSLRATWTGSLLLPAWAGTPAGEADGIPGLRQPGGLVEDDQTAIVWRVLVEEHELLDGDQEVPGAGPSTLPRLVYADTVTL